MMRFLIVVLLIAWSNQAYSDDIDLYIKNTASNVQRPSVLIVLDNSPSMVWYDVNGNYLSNRNVNNPNTRAHKAREIVIDLINDNPDVDFGLQLFNENSSYKHGGRIVFGLKDLSIPANKSALISILDTDTDNTNNNYTHFRGNGTPLCETLYETYRYLSGGALYYGNQDTSTPRSIITSGNYTSPFAGIQCNKEITIIYITDGDPTIDDNANAKVRALTGASTSDAENGNYLGVLGKWMATKNWTTLNGTTSDNNSGTDIADTSEDDILASVKIHTVGFGGDINATNLLKIAARDGIEKVEKTGFHDLPAGGKYYQASTAAALKTALQEVIYEVQNTSTLTSASVSANSFDRTQTLDSVYYGMFEPSTGARWQGNLKKYKIVNGAQVDLLGNAAVDSSGEFDEDAQSFWSSSADGNDVSKGGVAEMLRTTTTFNSTTNVTNRTLLTDIGGTGVLTEFSNTKIQAKYTAPADLAEKFAVPVEDVSDIPNHIKWAMGVDVDDFDKDNSTTDIRPDVFGDPLHSKPIVINYGTTDNANSRIVIGTNAGVLHMFEDVADDEVKENWAYLPQEFYKNIQPLRENTVSIGNKVYGLDGEITLHINDINKDGKVNGSDTAWLFFGLRRGGRSYYALDVTDPDKPELKWKKDFNDFSGLGQTWSKPQVVRSAYNKTDSDKLVVIFGGGYDTKKDASGPNTNDDTKGAAVYMVNARTGALIFKEETGAKNGIASDIASLDSDNDALVDRLYVGDTGGNVWRIDMPDDNLAHRSIIKLASVGGTTNTADLRFFNKPSIVRTYILETINAGSESEPNIVKNKVPYDAILLGSGDRTTPTNTETSDKFFMFKDKYIKTQRLDEITPEIDPITLSDLYDYTDDPFKGYPELTTAQEGKLLEASSKSGWHYDLTDSGEKTSAEAIVVNNVVYFTSYVPAAAATCSVTPGDAWLYAVDLALGFKKYNWDSEPGNKDDGIKHIGSQWAARPTLISTEVTDSVTGVKSLQGGIIVNKIGININFTLQTMRTSLTIQEN